MAGMRFIVAGPETTKVSFYRLWSLNHLTGPVRARMRIITRPPLRYPTFKQFRALPAVKGIPTASVNSSAHHLKFKPNRSTTFERGQSGVNAGREVDRLAREGERCRIPSSDFVNRVRGPPCASLLNALSEGVVNYNK